MTASDLRPGTATAEPERRWLDDGFAYLTSRLDGVMDARLESRIHATDPTVEGTFDDLPLDFLAALGHSGLVTADGSELPVLRPWL
jgi:hypothetical protein